MTSVVDMCPFDEPLEDCKGDEFGTLHRKQATTTLIAPASEARGIVQSGFLSMSRSIDPRDPVTRDEESERMGFSDMCSGAACVDMSSIGAGDVVDLPPDAFTSGFSDVPEESSFPYDELESGATAKPFLDALDTSRGIYDNRHTRIEYGDFKKPKTRIDKIPGQKLARSRVPKAQSTKDASDPQPDVRPTLFTTPHIDPYTSVGVDSL